MMRLQNIGMLTQQVHLGDLDRIRDGSLDGRVAGDERAGGDAELVECDGKRASNIGEPPVLMSG